MQQIHISKGVAMMIRAILGIEPGDVERQMNETILKSEEAFVTLKSTLSHFDERLMRIEAELSALKTNHARLNQILNRWDDERHDFNGHDRAEAGGHSTSDDIG